MTWAVSENTCFVVPRRESWKLAVGSVPVIIGALKSTVTAALHTNYLLRGAINTHAGITHECRRTLFRIS